MTRFVCPLFLVACTLDAPSTLDADPADDGLRIAESTPEAFGILALLNDASTSEALLDEDARLDARAARSLIHHRNGPDGVFSTADDDLFDNLAEVDACYYVGNAAIERLRRYALLVEMVPEGTDHVGEWDGVPFTMDQVTATLELANTASATFLDEDLGLDSRAVHGILDARPMSTMSELADAYYVGTVVLNTLKQHAAPDLAGVGETCDTSEDCVDGLVCLGEHAYGAGLFCVDESMYGNFTFDEATPIPDSGALTSSIEVSGLASVPVDVILTLDIDHPRTSDLVVTISNFNGYSEVVWDRERDPSREIVVTAFPSDDAVNGEYTLTVEDTVAGREGELLGWNLYIVSNWD